MLSFAALTVLSLLWLALRGRPFGRKSSVTLRSVYAIVVGFGGWFLAELIVLTALPTLALDGELLTALATGLPIGLAIYFAWARREWSAATKATGFAAATAGALVGAWLGFNVLAGLLGLVTALLGAVAGGNLALLALDIAWDSQARDRRAVAGEASPALLLPE
jgi:hypothetical protein